MINRPVLPPKRGYVEVEVDGRRLYRSVATGLLLEDEQPSQEADMMALTIDHEYRLTLLELGVI